MFYIIMSACLVIRNIIKQQTLIFAKADIYYCRRGAKILVGAAENFRGGVV